MNSQLFHQVESELKIQCVHMATRIGTQQLQRPVTNSMKHSPSEACILQ